MNIVDTEMFNCFYKNKMKLDVLWEGYVEATTNDWTYMTTLPNILNYKWLMIYGNAITPGYQIIEVQKNSWATFTQYRATSHYVSFCVFINENLDICLGRSAWAGTGMRRIHKIIGVK